ncbi:hypothetical protein GDO86_011493 [Hymenochirus boettgeri]|uniref:TPR and ankyrin repeat-containing protein 1 n=1 Tax=Hymenochirus boettgeri TaxID=247094 RepID=A0A8T2JGT4_9PIPI|nr:hypothetical protein GDO86_011493 [Hymenochirus boettgeri]
MKHLLDLYSSAPAENAYLNPNIQDHKGDTVMHQIFQSSNPRQYRQLMELLSKFDIKLTIKNKLGKDARHRIKNTDAHFIAWNEVKNKRKKDRHCIPAQPTKISANGNKPHVKSHSKTISHSLTAENADAITPITIKDSITLSIKDYIKSLDLTKTTESQVFKKTFNSTVNTTTEGNNRVSFCSNEKQSVLDNFCEEGVVENDFNNLTWEIECAPEALKKLGSKAMPLYMKKKIIVSIQKLGNGEWTCSLHKQLKYLKSDIKLFEVKLDKGARMLWELAVDFSPRCSEDPEKIMAGEESSNAFDKTGRVYTEIIRIWDIVLDHGKLRNVIEVICITKAQVSSTVGKKIPLCFIEDIELESDISHIISDYFPPASAAEAEYNIMKFHSFSTDMALNILNNINTRVEYPFRVGELEYAVIDLNPKPMEAIILIGRSGTGKTTCCLYRLWKKFHCYWEKAELVGGPWLVKQIWQRNKYEESLENNESETEYNTDTEETDGTDEEQIEQDLNNSEDNHCESEDGEEELGKLEHYHPIFVTKNHVLCQEVQRNFCELSKSTKATSHFTPVDLNIFRLQDLKDENFPLFFTSQQLLLLLDGSMPEPFFPRNEDGSLKKNIIGWSTLNLADIAELLRDDDYNNDDAEQESEEEETVIEDKERDPRVFVTFELFTSEIWPKMVKGKPIYNAALVWKEIKSFLKGSFEALNCPQGKLTEMEYHKLGKKRAPNFQEDRKEIYRLFSLYEQIKSKKGYFDEEDFLYNLSCRLCNLKELPWSIHELYADEIQDFTQAELFLLMRCINDPNSMFLTGDTAQSIMKGVSFRFSDLRSLFFYANRNIKKEQKKCVVRKPKRIYQLYQNYRSHSGILQLASGIVDLLLYFFPESFDRLPPDCGLFNGPKPIILESCSVSDLAILLRGNKRKTQPIEFGAHQVILVMNEKAKEKIPEELSLALVLTIYEAKGLEFDDVLLYNFFTNSEASKEWKIISSFKLECHSDMKGQPLIEIPLDNICMPTDRPWTMNPELHKMLNGDLKQLYTAITRARVNLWIFDENQEKRAPAFNYFVKRNFVKVVQTEENKELDDNMFVKTSTKEEWISQGDYYARHKCWKVAAKCYQKGEATAKEKLAFAHDAVLQLQTKKVSTREKQMQYLRLAKTYLECSEAKLALKCLVKAKEYRLCGELCRKLEKSKDAAYFFKKIPDNVAAAQCFEQAGELHMTLNLYRQEKMYEEAVDLIKRYKNMYSDVQLPYTTKQLSLEAAAHFFSCNKINRMNEILSNLDTEDQLVFLKKRRRWKEAANLLKINQRCEEAALLMRDHGELFEAAALTMNKEFRAFCLLAAVRYSIKDSDENKDLINTIAEAMQIFKEMENKLGIAECVLIQGTIKNDFHELQASFKNFMSLSHCAGAVEALYESVKCEESNPQLLTMAASGLQSLIALLKSLKAMKTNADKENVKAFFEFFGVVHIEGHPCSILQCEGARILNIAVEGTFENKENVLELAEVTALLERHLLQRLYDISLAILGNVYPESDICTKFIAGLDCTDENCQDFHRPVLRHELERILISKRDLITICGLLIEAKHLSKEYSREIHEILTAHAFHFCRSLLNVFFPKHFHLRILSENKGACKMFEEIRRTFPKPCINMIVEYGKSSFKQETTKMKRESTDLWLIVMFFSSISFRYPDELTHLLDEEEVHFNREYMLHKKHANGSKGDGRRLKGLDGKYGMLKPDESSGSVKDRHIHFFRLFQSSVDQLYFYKKPEECKTYFYRFLNSIVKKHIEPLIPNIGNTVMLLEFQFILCCTVVMRLDQGTKFLFPKSYISILHHWESMFGNKGTKSVVKDTYSILLEYKPRDAKQAIKRFKHHLLYLAKVLCGEEETRFNVLLDAFHDIDCISSGEAERTLVLCLVMMVNNGKVKSPETLIFNNIFATVKEELEQTKEMFPSKVPERLVTAVNNVSNYCNLEQVVDVLQSLLSLRDEEHLVECSWRWDVSYFKGSVRGVFYDDKFKFQKFVNHQATDLQIPCFDDEQGYFPEERIDVVAALASQMEQKHSAMRQFNELLLLICFCIKWKRACLKKRKDIYTEESIPESFKIADIDRTRCDLCGVKFSLRTCLFSAEAQDCEEEAVAPTTSEVDKSCCFDVSDTKNESYEDHIHLEKHHYHIKAYNTYLNFYKSKLNVVLSEAKSLVQTIKQITGDQIASTEELNLEQTKIEHKIKDIVDIIESIYEKKQWNEAELLLKGPLQALGTTLSKAEGVLNKARQHISNQKGFHKDELFEHEIDFGDFEELCSKKKRRAKGKSKRH